MKSALDVARERAESLEPIPLITNKLGYCWRQPDRREIQIDRTHALMTRATFERLAEYSASTPTAAYEGKMWKCECGKFDRCKGVVTQWELRWYGPHETAGMVSLNWRVILIADEVER